MRILIVFFVSVVFMLSLESSYSQTDYWQMTNYPTSLKVTSIAAKVGGYVFAASEDSGVYRSTNLGADWLRVITGLSYPDVLGLAVSANGDIFAGTVGVYRSSNNGVDWVPTGTLSAAVFCFAFKPAGVIFTGTGGGVYRSTNNGGTWAQASNGLPNPPSVDVWALVTNSIGHIFATASSSTGSGIYRSTNNGDNWSAINSGLTTTDVRTLAINSAGHLFAGTRLGGMFRSTDNGDTWTSSGIPSAYVSSTTINSRDDIFAGTINTGVYLSTDNGTSWTEVNTGLTNMSVQALAIDSAGFVYAGTYRGGIFRSVRSTTSAFESSAEHPLSYGLSQNYPNPFNPSTTIRYSLPHSSFVTLTVCNTLGQQVAQLVNGQQEAGYHDVVFRGDGLASGVYFYRIQAEVFVASRKLLLLK